MRYLAILLALSACGARQHVISGHAAQFSDRHELYVASLDEDGDGFSDYKIDQAEFEAVVDTLVQKVEAKTGWSGVARDLRGWGVLFRAAPFKCAMEGSDGDAVVGQCGGQTFTTGVYCQVGYTSPLAKSALAHELLHVIVYKRLHLTKDSEAHPWMTAHGLLP